MDNPSGGRYGSPFFSSLRGRLIFLVCLSTLPAILLAFFIADRQRTAELERTRENARHLVDLATREYLHQIQGAKSLLRWLGTRFEDETERSRILADPDLLRALLEGYPQLVNLGVVDPDGRVLFSAHPMDHFPNMSDNPAVQAAAASREVAVGKYIISPILKQPVLNLAYAVRSDAGTPCCVLFNGLNLQWLQDLASSISLPPEYSLLIADRDGSVLAHAGSIHPEIPGHDGIRIPELATLAESSAGRVLPVGDTGISRYFTVSPLESMPGLLIAAGWPYERVTRQANLNFFRTLGVLGLIAVLTIGSVIFATEMSVLRGLRRLASAVRRFGEGDLAVRAAVPRGYFELERLASTFNTMAKSLATQHEELTESQRRLRALSTKLHHVREEEAGRISRELHDEIGQILTAIKIGLTRLRAHCAEEAPPRACSLTLEDGIASMTGQISGAIDFVRRISAELRPNVLDRLGLVEALEWVAQDIESRTGLAVTVHAPHPRETLDWQTSVTFFRIAQEALTNVLRHAEADTVRVTLLAEKETVRLLVEDDGRGMDMTLWRPRDSLGILGMQERARMIHGRLEIHGEPGRGTKVEVIAPRHFNPGDDNADSARG